VVDGGGSTRVAIFGDHMAQLAMDHGWQGLIIHGAVRDVDRLRTLDLATLRMRSGRGVGVHGCRRCGLGRPEADRSHARLRAAMEDALGWPS